ncbi:MAG: YbhB/YbcL family Raf kinase inhibitor-like protein [Candidatus Cybelea sp.]
MLRTIAGGLVVAVTTGLMQVTSGDFSAGGTIPRVFMATRCGGDNRSPQLSWSGAPPNTKSFALIMHDPDAPMPGGFYHWVVYNLPPQTHQLAQNVKLAPDQLGATSANKTEYHGPCPPPGPAHHYIITIYALDIEQLDAAKPLDGPDVESRIAGHILARGALTGLAATQGT